MATRPAYRTRAFKDAKKFLRENYLQCWVTDEDGRCLNRGTIPDHSPPLAYFPDPLLWSGTFLPHCKKHSDRQSGMMAHGRVLPAPSREW